MHDKMEQIVNSDDNSKNNKNKNKKSSNLEETLKEFERKLDSMYDGNENLNVFVKSQEQIKLRLPIPGFSFQRNEKAFLKMISNFGDICDVDNIVSSQMGYLFNNKVSKIPNGNESSISCTASNATFLSKIVPKTDAYETQRALRVDLKNNDNAFDNNHSNSRRSKHLSKTLPIEAIRIRDAEIQIARMPSGN